MDKPTDRWPYHPPQITRVVLNRQQAILSQCSLQSEVAEFLLTVSCVVGDCKGTNLPGNRDSAGRPS